MKVLQIFNQYRSQFNGEAMVVRQTAELIERFGGKVFDWQRNSQKMKSGVLSKIKAAVGGIYNRTSYRDARAILEFHQPDVVHTHNVYPLFSPSVLVAAKDAGYPVVMSVHNQHLTCPKADHLLNGKLCDRCYQGAEINCVLQNCRNNIFESMAYAIRSHAARSRGWFSNNVTRFIALTEFSRQRLVGAGYAAEKINVLSNMVTGVESAVDRPEEGGYVAFAGRMSEEKGVDLLIDAAKELPTIPFKLAGNGPCLERWQNSAPNNVEFLGGIEQEDMPKFYRGARLLVLPSRVNEMCPLVVSEAMNVGIPVITSNMGGQAELVDDQITGRLFEPENASDLRKQIEQVWHRTDLIREYGRAGFEKARREYRQDVYFKRLVEIYRQAILDVGRDDTCIDNILANTPEDTRVLTPASLPLEEGFHEASTLAIEP